MILCNNIYDDDILPSWIEISQSRLMYSMSSFLQNDFSNLQRHSLSHSFFKMCFHGLITFNIKLVLKTELKDFAGSQGC